MRRTARAAFALVVALSVHAASPDPGRADGIAQEPTAAGASSGMATSHPPGSVGRPPEPGTLFLHPERFELEDGSLGAVDRGVLFAPVNRSRPASGVLAVEFWRFRAHEGVPDDRPPIFRLPGGPGYPGLAEDLERPGEYEEEIEPLLDVADVVVVGQRGIGASRPTTACEGPPAPPAGADGSARRVERERLLETAQRCRRWWEAQDLDLQAFTVLEAADDVNDVRKALGYDRITLHGVSFGSHWAMAVMRRHPGIVARALLSGMEGPDHTYDSPTGVLNALERIAADAEDAPVFEGRVPDGGFVAALRRTVERLDSEPIPVTVARDRPGDSVTVTLDGDAVRDLAEGYLGSVEDRRWEASWPAGVLLLAEGDYRRAARELTPPAETSGGGFWPTASYFMLDCSSGITAEREEQLLSDPARQVVGAQADWYRATCPAWNADLGDAFRRNFDTEIPTLVVHGTWDMSTPLENALELVPHFRNGRFVRVERGSHGALSEALSGLPDFREKVRRFLATGRLEGLPRRIELPEPDWLLPGDLPN